MKLNVILRNRRIDIIVAIILILIFLYIVFKSNFPVTDPVAKFLSNITGPYLFLVERFANIILHWTGSPLSIQNHSVSLNGKLINGFTIQIMYIKVTFFYILVLWLTRTITWKKIYFTGIYLVLGFLSASFYIVAGAYSVSGDFNNASIISINHGIVFFCMNTTMFIWYLINKESYYNNSPDNSVIIKLIEKKLLDIIIILYGFLVVKFALVYFDFNLYINFLLLSSKGILELLGYDAALKPYLLMGNNGSVFVHRACLGFVTMYLFAALVYLTGNKHKRGWGYIIFGFLILNLLNILRLVLLFIHIQKHGDYVLTMDVHDLYNYAIYFIVFILWVIWFERLMDFKTMKSIRTLIKKYTSRLFQFVNQ